MFQELLEMEECEQQLKRAANATPLKNILSCDYDGNFPDLVKAEVWDILMNFGTKNCHPELHHFYNETIINNPTTEQKNVVKRLYDTFYHTFALSRPSTTSTTPDEALPVVVVGEEQEANGSVSDIVFIPPMYQVMVQQGEITNQQAMDMARLDATVSAQEAQEETKDEQENSESLEKKNKELDAHAFAKLLAYASKHEMVRLIFLHFHFETTFVDDFNLKRNVGTRKNSLQVLNLILEEIVFKGKGLWGKNVGKALLHLLNFPTTQDVPVTSEPSKHSLRPVAPTSSSPQPRCTDGRHRPRHRGRKHVPTSSTLSSLPSAPPCETKDQKDVRCPAKRYLDSKDTNSDDDTSSSSSSSSSSSTASDSTMNSSSLPPLVDPSTIATVADHGWEIVSTSTPTGLAAISEATWLKKSMKKYSSAPHNSLSHELFNQLMNTNGYFIARYCLRAAKFGKVKAILDKIPLRIAKHAFACAGVDDNTCDVTCNPLIGALVKTRSTNNDQLCVMECIIAAKLCTNEFFRSFLRAALCGRMSPLPSRPAVGKTRLIKRFMDTLFFSNDGHYHIVALRRCPNVSPILLEELSHALQERTITINDDTVSLLVEYALRFESLFKSHSCTFLYTIQQWMENDSSRTDVFSMYVRDNRYFAKWLANIAAPNSELANRSRVDMLQELNNDYKQRQSGHLSDALQGYISTSLSTIARREGETKQPAAAEHVGALEHFLKLPKMSDFFETWWDLGGICERTTNDLLTDCGIRTWFAPAILNRDLLIKPEHFSDSVIRSLQASPVCLEDQQFCALTLAAIKLGQYRNLSTRLQSIEIAIDRNDEAIRQLGDITRAVLDREEKDFQGLQFTPEIMRDCAQNATRAKIIVSHQASSTRRLQLAFDHYLSTSSPAAWAGLFKSVETIAFFIKYLDRENLKKAYTAYAACNQGSQKILKRLKAVEKVFTKPFIEPKDFNLERGHGERAMEKLLVTLENTNGLGAIPILKRLTAAWLRDRMNVLNVPMPPRNCQSITFLLAATWLAEAVKKKKCNSFIAQVGTGEGKSLVIAMMACYAVKSLGKKVHVLENNVSIKNLLF